VSFIDWPGELRIGVAELDREHEQLVRIINDLHDVASSAQHGRDVAGVLLDLVRHTREHFQHEEAFMARCAYSAAAEHAREHGELLVIFSHLLGAMSAEKARLDPDTLEYIRRWLCSHIENSDAALARFALRDKGITAGDAPGVAEMSRTGAWPRRIP